MLHAKRSGVVGRKREGEIVLVERQKIAEIVRAGVDVFGGIENIMHAEPRGGFRQ